MFFFFFFFVIVFSFFANNEIVYIETGEWPLEIRITKQQINFWLGIQNILANNPAHYISKLVNLGENTGYVKFYRKLVNTFSTSKNCVDTLRNNFKEKFSSKIQEAAREDEDSKLGTYMSVNPTLSK